MELIRQHGGDDSPKPDISVNDRLAAIDSFREAAGKDDLKRIKTQLKYNPDLVFIKEILGGTPLHYAASRGKRDLVELLL
ncbi:hypothetical protein Q8G81_33145, partial [Klebsiella pneumoniae]